MRPCFLVLCTITVLVESKKCGLGIIERGVNSKDSAFIVQKHNDLRKRVARGELTDQPQGINLRRVYWDELLANATQELADLCIFEKVDNVKDDRWKFVGQNTLLSQIWTLTGQTVNGSEWESAIDTWFKQHESYHYPNGVDCEHYTQLVWANTRYIGCGYLAYRANKHYLNKIYICSYGPGANISEPPYKEGKKGCEDLC